MQNLSYISLKFKGDVVYKKKYLILLSIIPDMYFSCVSICSYTRHLGFVHMEVSLEV